MDSTILKLAKQHSRTPLKEYIGKLSTDEIENVLKNKLTQPIKDENDPAVVLRCLLVGDPNGEETRQTVVRTVVEWLGNDTESTNGSGVKVKLATTAINLILPEIEMLTPRMLDDAAHLITQFIQKNVPVQPRLFEVLSKIYNVLSTVEAKESTKAILDKICESSWHTQASVGLASCMNELELSASELTQVIQRMFAQLKELDVEEIPPFIYQLLLLSRKGSKRDILAGICDYFDWLHGSTNTSDTSRMEGTVMLHISFAIKQDQELGTELIKYIKNDKLILSDKFKIACLLSAARIHRLEDTIFDLLKGTIISFYKDQDRLQKCAWIAKYSDLNSISVRNLLMDIADRSALGWDQVIQSLTQLAIILIDSAANNHLRVPETDRRSKSTGPGPLDKVIALGIDVLVRMFKLHDVARTDILEQIAARVISRSNSSTHFLYLLEKLTTDCQYEIDKYISTIKDTLDYLSLLPLFTAQKLLTAIQPVSRSNYQFRDNIILVLRKSMFSRELDSRMVAVNGFLSILQNQLDIANQQGSSSTMGGNQGVAFEILGLLRRCFSQQYEVRVAAYNGLGLLATQYTSLSGDIFEILYAQFLHTFETDTGVTPPLKLSSCVDSGVKSRLLDPIHLLLINLLKTVRNLRNIECHSVITTALSSCKDHLKSLTFRLTKLDMEDYGLDKTTNFDTSTSTGMQSYHYAELLLGVLETVLEHEFIEQGDTIESCQTILTLFKKRKTLVTLIKESPSKDKGRILTNLASSTSLSLEFCAMITKALFLHGDQQSPILTLRSDIDFMHYVVSMTPIALAAAIDTENIQEDNTYFGYCVDLAKVYIHILIHEDSDSSFINHQPKKGQSLLSSIACSLKYILETTSSIWSDRLFEFLSSLEAMTSGGDLSKTLNGSITYSINQFKEVLSKYLNAQIPLYKESTTVFQVIAFLCNQLDHTEDDYTSESDRVIQWLTPIAQERPIEDVGVVKETVGLIIQLCADANQFATIKKFAEDVQALQGEVDINEDSQTTAKINYQIVNAKTHSVIALQILSFTDQMNETMIWCIGRLKVSAITSETERHDEFEQTVCGRLASYVDIIGELNRAALTGPHAENLIKVLTKTYRTFTVFVKYKMTAPKVTISQDFIKLIANIGSKVTENMYKFLTMYANHRQEEYDQAGNTRKKKGKKKEINAKEKAKILREAKTIPGLIFVVEQFERHLIQLTRKSKVDLMQYMKRSTSRDFQIKLDNYIVDQNSSDEDSSSKSKRGLETSQLGEDEEEDQIEDSISDGEEGNRSRRKRSRN